MAQRPSLIERIAPARLGPQFRSVLAASISANFGDGLLIACGPLLIASITSDPLLVSLGAFMGQLPWLIISPFAGIIIDRVRRVPLMLIASWSRVAVLAILIACILTGNLAVWVVYASVFLVGIAEVFLDTTWMTMVPDVVPAEHLGLANARLSATSELMNRLLGPALGGFFFAAASWLPYGTTAVMTLLAAYYVSKLKLPPVSDATASVVVGGTVARVRQQFQRGIGWLWNHPAMRTLTALNFVFNLTLMMSFSVLVLYAREVLGLDAAGYGLLMSVSAMGGLIGAAAYDRLEATFSYTAMLRVCVVLEAMLHGSLALASHWAAAAVILFLSGMYMVVWGTICQTIRGRSVPTRLRGRVTGVYMLASFGGAALGAPIGGVIARAGGVTLAMWWAFGLTAVAAVLVWGLLSTVGRAGEVEPEPGAPGSPS